MKRIPIFVVVPLFFAASALLVFMALRHGIFVHAVLQHSETAAALDANSAGLSSDAAQEASSTAALPFVKTYTNATYRFSFNYPALLSVGGNTANGATTILAQNATEHIGMQIYITPWSGPDVSITPERIEESLPDIVLSGAQSMRVGGGEDGLSFYTQDPNFGKSWQVWFIYKGNLYQISTYASQQPLLFAILKTWKFL